VIRATLAIDGMAYPLAQVTLRRQLGQAVLDMQIAGDHAIASGAACVLSVTGAPDIHGTVTAATPGPRLTTVTAEVDQIVGVSVYAPDRVQFRSSMTVRADLDFAVLPGDTYQGLAIASVTHTMGAASPWFTEVRF
jgi:hypothetical protein